MLQNGAQSVEKIAGGNIIYSKGVGKTNADEIKWLTETVVKEAAAWKSSGWGYSPDCTQMDPVTPDVGNELVNMTKAFVENGCKAIAFVDGASAMLKAQGKSNTKRSNTGLLEEHFETKDQAVNWLKSVL